MEERSPLAQRLEDVRKDAGLTFPQLAEELHFSQRTLRRYAKGDRRPERDTVGKWAEACRADAAGLLALYDGAPARRPRWPWAVAAAGVLVIIAVVLLIRRDDGPRIPITVSNQVTDGLAAMREDPTPVTLTSIPRDFCGRNHCLVAHTERVSGQTFDGAVCQTRGVPITNGDDKGSDDDANPGLATSDRYFGVRLKDGTFGYVSEVWILRRQRGGLGLPACES